MFSGQLPDPLPLSVVPLGTGPWLRLGHIELGQTLVYAKVHAQAGIRSPGGPLLLRPRRILVVQQTGFRLDADAHIVVHRVRVRVQAADVDVDLTAAAAGGGTSLGRQLDVGAAGEGGVGKTLVATSVGSHGTAAGTAQGGEALAPSQGQILATLAAGPQERAIRDRGGTSQLRGHGNTGLPDHRRSQGPQRRRKNRLKLLQEATSVAGNSSI